MKFDIPLSVSFRSKIVKGVFFTLDGEKEVKAPTYSKYIKSIDELSEVEQHYILIKYANYNKHLNQLAMFIDKMKI